MKLIVLLLLCSFISTLSFHFNSRVLMGVTKKTVLQAKRKATAVKTEVVPTWQPPATDKDVSRITKFDLKVYEACCNIPKGELQW